METKQNTFSITERLILFFVLRTKGFITKTQLVKFIYLADLYSTKWLGKQITDLEWVYYRYGPWEKEIQLALDRMECSEILKKRIDKKDTSNNSDDDATHIIGLGPEAPKEEELEIPYLMELVLENIRREWAGSGPENLKKLLDYVYNTEPMKAVLADNCDPKEKRPLNLLKEKEKISKTLGAEF